MIARGKKKELVLVILMIFLITALHYMVSLHAIEIHAFYRRLYYLPIIYASFKFGLRGGVAAALASSFFYFPHLIFYVGHIPAQLADNFYEVILFNIIGWATGILSESEKRLAEQVRHSEKLSALGVLIAGLAHEIRNPLGIISATAQLLKEDQDQSTLQEGLEIIRQETTRLNQILTQLIDFAKPSPSQGGFLNLNELITESIPFFRKLLEEQGIKLQTALSGNSLTIYFDPQKFKQLLINLVLNSSQAMPRGGIIEISTWEKEGRVFMQVRDNGQGISQEILPQIFNPFFTTKEQGTGLGLSIVHRIIGDYQGKIKVESTVNEETKVMISLPKGEKDEEK